MSLRANCLKTRAFLEAELFESLGHQGLVVLGKGPLSRLRCPRPWAVEG